ncbi:transposase [Ectothiorhodospira lacustris]|uniref:transposase n=1 Tax=Ectothiorhodospira lacustris TaxID=2899127 RepID=UPI001EE7D1A2|nr:transposase [Ectothiorhodospira lacustris]MCG5509490.1 transposase [Ectothiorhodospira lacustris]MCG5521544.1 transposase [Ectothiorhodospira lacustris]
MAQPRHELISLSETPWYHVVSRCVRRAFLCGRDQLTGMNYGHRRGWIEERMLALSGIFAIDIAAYAVMSNHYHIVLRVDAGRGLDWGVDETLKRWTQLFNGPSSVQRYLAGGPEQLSAAEMAQVEECAELYRARLHDLSWFMRVLNESIARQANQEDGVKGRFWEGRFKSQALLDEQALLAAMAYVDLNPVRARVAQDLQSCEFTGIARRIRNVTRELAPQRNSGGDTAKSQPQLTPLPAARSSSRADHTAEANRLRSERHLKSLQPAPLMPFSPAARFETAIPFAFADYLELVDILGRCLHPMKRGRIPEKTPRLLLQMGMETEAFVNQSANMLKTFGPVIGTPETLCKLALRQRKQRVRGIRVARAVFSNKAA